MALSESLAIAVANQVFEIEKKSKGSALEKSLQRNIARLKQLLEEEGYRTHNPLGEPYQLTRLDCEAMVAGDGASSLRIVEVIKPIIYFQEGGRNQIVQKGVVITESS